MNKHIARTLMLLVVGIVFTLEQCSFDGDIDHMPASWSKYKIDTVANEPLLLRQYPESNVSGCGLSNDDFIKYARDRIDYGRQFQFIVFVSGKPLVGERCLRKAFIFYLK